jgi:hypothetical protein
MRRQVISGIRPSFPGLSQSQGQVAHVLLTRSPLEYPRRGLSARLACVKHAASVRPEPGSNSPRTACEIGLPARRVAARIAGRFQTVLESSPMPGLARAPVLVQRSTPTVKRRRGTRPIGRGWASTRFPPSARPARSRRERGGRTRRLTALRRGCAAGQSPKLLSFQRPGAP